MLAVISTSTSSRASRHSAERIFIAGFPSLQVYGNDSLINLEVFSLNADNSQGAPVVSLNGVRCAPTPSRYELDEDAYYLVKVSGSPGRYTLRNSVDGDERRFPDWAAIESTRCPIPASPSNTSCASRRSRIRS